MFHSIRTRLAFIFLCFFLLLESIQLTSIYLFIDQAYKQQKETMMLQAFDEINDEEIEDATIYEDIVAIMQDYEVTSNLYFCLIDRSSDKVLYSTNESIRDSVDFTHVNDDKYDEEADPVTVEGYNSNHWLALYRSILTDEHCYNTIIWTCYEAEFNNTIWGILPILLLTILVSCVLSAILAFPFSNHIVKPIRRIDKVAQRIARQDFSSDLPLPKSKDELFRLSENINLMSKQLEKDMNTLKDINATLAKDIDEKQRIDKMRREFLSNVSHELKTPLAIVSSYAEMLKYEGEHIDRDEYLEVILEESKQMSQMIGKLLELSRLEHATESMNMVPANLSELTESLLDTRKLLFEQKGLTLTCKIEPDIIVNADEIYLAQAMGNYIANALKYSSENGTVTITLEKKEDNAYFSVSNPCTPLDDKDLDAIWESFYKTDKSRTKDNKDMSVGLGLYIVKTIILAHHGSYGVENLPDGVRFYLSLPIKYE